MKMTKKLIVLAVCLFCASSLFALQGTVLSVSGKVEVQEDDEWIPLEEGDELDAGAVISTGFKSEAVIALDETTITVKALTRLTLEQLFEQNGNKASTMYLDAGSISASVRSEEDKKVAFKVKTPAVTASVRGTDGVVYINRVEGISGSWLLTPPEPKLSKAEIKELAAVAKEILNQVLEISGDNADDEVENAEISGDEANSGDEGSEEESAAESEEAVVEQVEPVLEATESVEPVAETAGSGELAVVETVAQSESSGPAEPTTAASATPAAQETPVAPPVAQASPEAPVTPAPMPAQSAFNFDSYFSSLDQVGGVIVHKGEVSTVATTTTGAFQLNTPQQTAVESATSLGSSTVTPSSQESVAAPVPQAPVNVAPSTPKKTSGSISITVKWD